MEAEKKGSHVPDLHSLMEAMATMSDEIALAQHVILRLEERLEAVERPESRT